MITEESISFLEDLKKNNNREWFADNKDRYDHAWTNAKEVKSSIQSKLGETDEIEKSKLFRIYRDVRFSKDKTPYSPHLRMSFTRAGAERRGGYYVHISPGESLLGMGFWNPNPADLKLIRSQISQDPESLREILSDSKFKKVWGELSGEAVKTAPKGFSKDDPAIDLIRYKQYIATTPLSDEEIRSENLDQIVADRFLIIRPFFDYFSDILTHDLNGESLIE